MTFTRSIAFGMAVLALFAASATAQTKKPKPKVTKPTVVTSSNVMSVAGAVTATQKVSNQVTNVAKFLYILGGIAKGIEDVDKDPKANRSARDMNATNKKTVLQTIRNLRAGLAALEVEFRTNAALKRYLPQIEGITDLSAQSEDLAGAGRFAESGRPLVTVIGKLADTLAAMP